MNTQEGLLPGREGAGGGDIATVTFMAILIQATATNWLAERLGVLEQNTTNQQSG